MPNFDVKDANCELTVEDGGEVNFGTLPLYLASHAKNNTAYRQYVINLNGGVFRAAIISRYKTEVVPSDEFPEGTGESSRANSYGLLNANGGTFKVSTSNPIFGSRAETSVTTKYPITRATVFSGGLTIDLDGKDASIGVGGALRAPYGSGVASIPWDAATDGVGFIGSPIVKISGDGQGACAYAEYDPTNRLVTAIRVVAPGNGYTTATANISYGYGSTPRTVACTLAPNVSGGVTVKGGGSLTVYGTNTYTGATAIKTGTTVKLGADDVFASSSELRLEGGVLDMQNYSQTFASVGGTSAGGSVQNGTVTLSGLAIDFAKALAGERSTVDFTNISFAPGAVVSLAGYDIAALEGRNKVEIFNFASGGAPSVELALDPAIELPERWGLIQTRYGLKIAKHRGLVLEFK